MATRFNDYAKRVDNSAREHLRAIETAQNELRRAEQLNKEAIQSHDERRMLNAKGNLLDCQDAAKRARKDAEIALDGLRGIPAELDAAITAAATVDPEKVDGAALELMKSGIMTATDYQAMSRKYSENPTMLRLLAKYSSDAGSAAESDTERQGYNVVSHSCKAAVNFQAQRDGMEVLLETYRRCVNNPAMIKSYEALTADIVRDF